jgi:acetoacetyl-CoA synthetase
MIEECCSALPPSTAASALTLIWERVLQRSSIAPDDDFFAIGGTPALANRLFEEIDRDCGRELSPLTIYQAPTIAALAAILERPELPRFRPIVPLKPGTENPPIFMVHGLGGSVMEFFRLAKQVDTQRVIYGVQRRGIDGIEVPLERIEDLARHNIDAVQAVQPHGPYTFVGFSLGGLVTLEMAQQITRTGEKVALLVLIETFPRWRYMSLWQNALIARRLGNRAIEKLLYRLKIRSHAGGDECKNVGDYPRLGKAFAPVMERNGRTDILFWKHYKPQYYDGKITYIGRTQGGAKFPTNPAAVWGPLAKEFVMEKVAGDHLGIMSNNYEDLAALLSGFLQGTPPVASR